MSTKEIITNENKDKNIIDTLSPTKIILPIMIGLGVIIYLLVSNIDVETFINVNWSLAMVGWILLGIGLVCLRHFLMMYRIRRLTDRKLTWYQSFNIIALWEFASAATPSVVGGTAVAFFLLQKEKIKAGESITIVLTTIVLDGMFFLISIPLLFVVLGNTIFSPSFANPDLQKAGFWIYFFGFGYLFMATYTLLFAYGLFFKPHSFKWLLTKITSIPFLKRWQKSATQTGEDMIIASQELKQKDRNFWLAGIFSSIAIWTVRFLIMNCVIAAFVVVGSHLLVVGRQLMLYILLLLPVSPGGAGIAEVGFNDLFADFFIVEKDGIISVNKGLSTVISAIWRLITYYSYLILGVIILPNWLRSAFKSRIK